MLIDRDDRHTVCIYGGSVVWREVQTRVYMEKLFSSFFRVEFSET